jgi:hypothetical protein
MIFTCPPVNSEKLQSKETERMGYFLYLIPVAVYLFYKWATSNHDFFVKQGIAFIRPLPLLGSNFSLFFKKQPFVKSLMDNYNKFKSEK